MVLQLSSMVPPTRHGGAERVVSAFAEELTAAGLQVHNSGLKPRGADDSEPGMPIRNIYWPFDERRRGGARRTVWHAIDTLMLTARSAVENLVNELQPDVMITHNLRGWGFAPWVIAQRHGIPLVHIVHDYALMCNSSMLWRNSRNCDGVCRLCWPRVHATRQRWPGGQVIGVSASVLAEHRRRGLAGFDEAVVVYPIAAGEISQCSTHQRAEVLPPSTVGYMGRLADAKGIATLLAAIEGGDQRLLVAGEGERNYVSELKTRTSGQVEWRGWTDPESFFGQIDLLVVPSVWLEPFGVVVVEAARAGVPVLIADRPGLVEAARVSGARYATFVGGDVGSLREALNQSLSCYRAEPTATAGDGIADIVTRLLRTRPTS